MKKILGVTFNSPCETKFITLDENGCASFNNAVDLYFCPKCGMVFVDVSKEKNHE